MVRARRDPICLWLVFLCGKRVVFMKVVSSQSFNLDSILSSNTTYTSVSCLPSSAFSYLLVVMAIPGVWGARHIALCVGSWPLQHLVVATGIASQTGLGPRRHCCTGCWGACKCCTCHYQELLCHLLHQCLLAYGHKTGVCSGACLPDGDVHSETLD